MRKCLLPALAIMLLVSAIGIGGCKSTPQSSFMEMLKLIPDTASMRAEVYINDFAKIREIYDIPLPSSDADGEAITDYIIMLAGDPSVAADDPSAGRRLGERSFISGMGPSTYAFMSPIRKENIGFGPQDVDQDILAGIQPVTFEAIKGRYDTSAIEQAINRYESETPQLEQYEGMTVVDWGYGGNEIMLQERLLPPCHDHLGRCRPLGIGDDYVFRAFDTDSVKMMIDASQGERDSLADNSDFSLMAEALWEMEAHSVFLSDRVQDMDFQADILALKIEGYETPEDIIAEAGQLLSSYRTYAVGVGRDEEGPLMTIVLVYDSSEEASSDVSVFEQQIEEGTSLWTGEPWRDFISSWEVWADGRSLRVKLRGEIISDWLRFPNQPDTLLLQR